MSLLLTQLGKVELARSYFRDIRTDNDFYYFCFGKTTEWADEDNPPASVDQPLDTNQFRRNIMFIKKITSANVCSIVRRIDWTSGEIYDRYDDQYLGLVSGNSGYENRSWRTATKLFNANFYVLTDDYNIYKCIDNRDSNGDVTASLDKPTTTGVEVQITSDNYHWKYLGTITDGDKTRFLDDNWMPVRKLVGRTQSDGTPDENDTVADTFDVNGELDTVTIVDGGSGYVSPQVSVVGDGVNGDVDVTVSAGVITTATISQVGNGYSFALVQVQDIAGTGAQLKLGLGDVDSALSLDQAAVENSATKGTIDRIEITTAGVGYTDGDTSITVTGDGSGATAIPTIDNNGSISGITITNAGSNYTFANVTITEGVGTATTLATARAVVSPINGHGSNIVRELFSTTLALSISLSDPDNEDLILNNDFRQIGLIKNVKEYTDASQQYNNTTGRATFEIELANATEYGKYTIDDTVTTASGGEFIVAQKLSSTSGYFIYLIPVIPEIQTASPFEDLTVNSDTTLAADINSISVPEFSTKTGEIVYVENRGAINRTQDQAEIIKAFVTF